MSKTGLLADEKVGEWIEALRAQCSQQLPLNANGKLDRKALPAPDKHYCSAQQVYVAPRDALEQQLALLWSDLLKLNANDISIHDDFFKIGGNSILMITLMNRVKSLLQINITLTDIYKNSSIATFVNFVQQQSCKITNTQDILLNRGDEKRICYP